MTKSQNVQKVDFLNTPGFLKTAYENGFYVCLKRIEKLHIKRGRIRHRKRVKNRRVINVVKNGSIFY